MTSSEQLKGQIAQLTSVASQGPPLIDKTTEALDSIVLRCTPQRPGDDVQLDTLSDAYADHVVQMMAVSLRKLNRLLGPLVEGHGQPSEEPADRN